MGTNISGMSSKFPLGDNLITSPGVGGRVKESDAPSSNGAPNTRPLPQDEEKMTSSSAHQGYAASSTNFTMRWNVDEKYRKRHSLSSLSDARQTVAKDSATAKVRYERPSIEEIIFEEISESASNTRQTVNVQDPNLRDLVKRVKNNNLAVPIAAHTLLAAATRRDMQQTLMVYQQFDNLLNDKTGAKNVPRLHLYNSVKQMLEGPEHKKFWWSHQDYDYEYFGEEKNIPKQFWNDITEPNAQKLSDAAVICDSLSLKLNPFFVEQATKLIDKRSDERSEAFDELNDAIWNCDYPGKKEDVLKNPQKFVAESYNAISLALGGVGTHISILKRQMALCPELQTNENQQQIQMTDAVYEKACDVINQVDANRIENSAANIGYSRAQAGMTNSVTSFKSTQLDNFYFAPFRPTQLREALTFKETRKWIANKAQGHPSNQIKSATNIQRVSPPFQNAADLDVEQCKHFAKQAYICRASTNRRGAYERGKFSDCARFLSEITTLDGRYDLHPSETNESKHRIRDTSRKARTFLNNNFPEEVRSIIMSGKGAFTDKNTGLSVSFLFEHPPGDPHPTLHVVFPGTGSGGKTASHSATDVAMLIEHNHIPPSFIQARNIVEMVKNFAEGKANIEVKGFSLGGAIAVYAGLSNEISTTTLSPLALSPGVWKSLIDEKQEKFSELVEEILTNLTVEGDLATGHTSINSLARKAERTLSLKMPHILGKTYVVRRENFPENIGKSVLGYGEHNSAAKLWSNLYEQKRAVTRAGQHVVDTAPTTSAGTRPERAQSEVSGHLDEEMPSTEEHMFITALCKFSINYHVVWATSKKFRGIIDQVKRLSSSYEQLGKQEKINALGILEQDLVAYRTGSTLNATNQSARQLYAAVVSERNHLLSPPTGGWPIRSLELDVPLQQSNSLLDGISAACQSPTADSTIDNAFVDTQNNAILPMTLKTGDEIAPAIYALIRNAEHKVNLQTYLFYEKSESAKWLHKALDELQQRQLEKKQAGTPVTPIEVEILLDDSRGVARQDLPGDGGLFQRGRLPVPRKNNISNYGIGYPAKLDPSLIKLTVKGIKHHKRGTLHSKTVSVDDRYSLVSTNNFKGTHHKISSDGDPRFDAGIIFSGEASLAISSDLITMSENAANNVIGSNAHEAPISSSENTKQYSLPTESHPTVHHGNIKAWGWKGLDLEGELNHANHIVSQIDQFHNIDPTKSKARIITITKPADNSLYSRTNTSAQRKAFLHALSSAQSYIRITNVNLNVPEVIDALVAATARGVRVEIVLPDGEMEMESAIDAKTNCQAYNELQTRIDALGKSEFLDLRWQTSSLGDLARKGKNHSKYMNADGVAFLGSTNLDIQSWKYSAELTVATTDVDAVRDLDQECFVNLFQRAVPFKNLFSVLRSNDD